MTALRQTFAKPIDRLIDSVIKADDEGSLRIELEEYVITNEISQRLEHFLDAYNNYSNANGVWISGFFGSGKSHLLKMLALLLENRVIDGVPAFDLFNNNDKLKDNPMLAGALRKATAIPSQSILFNIDQKADVISKGSTDALLAVFQKVFDEMCGYYGKQAHIARFERDLDARGQLEQFRQAYEDVAGKPWERGREQSVLEKANISKAYARIAGGAADGITDILGQYRSDTAISIEDFANTVKAWIDTKGRNFRLNFFVDEVGQYIADNVKLMTNLQTIAESLNTKCKGQAWVIVTAQQDMSSIIGDMNPRQEHDFSKIMGRFSTKMPLNSADVAEVIQRRLLEKTDEGEVILGNIYDREENNLRTLFEFADGSISLKNFRSREHFIASYPFPPYQYTLFQMAIGKLSEHNAFEGRHSSVGERSMLGVFQTVAKKISSAEMGELAPFDLMFEGIRTALKSSVQQSVQVAEQNLDDPFAVRVLKSLFLVKYVKEFKPSVRNIAILLMTDMEADQVAERRRIEEALSKLERNTLIQRNGDVYEFLTNEEKDVEDEIKATDIDLSEIQKELEALVFDTIIRHRKIKYNETGHEYPFSRKLDDQLVSREQHLGVNVISPFATAQSPSAVQMESMTKTDVVVLLEQDERFMRDLTQYKKTQKFVRQARLGSDQPARDRIVDEKGELNSRRYKDLETRLRRLMSEARIFVRGDEIEVAGDAQDRVAKAFQTLVEKVYVNLPMLRGVNYTDADILKAALPDSTLFSNGDEGLTEAEQEVFNFVQSQARNGVKVSAKALTEEFDGKSYGWPTPAILCITASLTAKGKVEARSDGSPLEGADLAKMLQNSQVLANILMTPQAEFTAAQVRKAKEFFAELFDRPADGNDARSISTQWANAVSVLILDIDALIAQEKDYPFVAALRPMAEQLKTFKGKPASWYIEEAVDHEDAILDSKEDILAPIRTFMGGPQKAIYDESRDFLTKNDANFLYVGHDTARSLRAVLDDPKCYKGGAVQGLKTKLSELKTAIDLMVLEERKSLIAAIEACAQKIAQVDDFVALDAVGQEEVLRHLDAHKDGVNQIDVIGVLRDRAAGVKANLFSDCLTEIARLKRPEPVNDGQSGGGGGGFAHPKQPAVRPTYVNAADIKVLWNKPFLTDEADVDTYFDQLKEAFRSEIRQGKKVIV